MKRIIVFILLLIYLIPATLSATEQYARQTGHACARCHLDQAGGGELTHDGRVFQASITADVERTNHPVLNKWIHFAAGYLHFLTAFLWFGTILYVHLVLKPGYAASGLPHGELRVGMVSMIVMGITGGVLTYYRVTSTDTLLHTRFGVLLLIKIALYLVMVISAVIVITIIGPRLKKRIMTPSEPVAPGNMTPEELALCDGKEGRPAYFAYEGSIYDATHSPFWKQGHHMGRHNAGADLTDMLKQAPHGEDKVASLRVIGNLSTDMPLRPPLHIRFFFFMAYMNLGIVFIVVLILALWRWF